MSFKWANESGIREARLTHYTLPWSVRSFDNADS